MRKEHDIFFDEEEHIYLVDGEEVPSVTSILEPLHRSYGSVNPSVLEYAANRGRAVHEATEAIDYGLEPEVDPDIQGYVDAYLDWSLVYRPSWIGIEQIVCHEAPMLTEDDLISYPDYIGTLDRIGYFNGDKETLNIVDIKTSQPTKEALISVTVQTVAYAEAFDETRWNKINRYGLFLKKDGTWRFQNCKEYEEKYGYAACQVWWHLLDHYRIINRLLNAKAVKK